MTPATQQVLRRPADVDEETIHELFQWFSGIDVDHPDYAERRDAFATVYREDLAAEWAER